MKYIFSNFKRLLFESILEEDKSRMIDMLVLPDITNENEKLEFKKMLKDYFKKYSAFEKFIDWNKWKTLTRSDFDEVFAKADQSSRARKSKEREGSGIDAKSLFKNENGRLFKIIDETSDWLFVAPLNYAAAVFCDSKECGGGSAKWCIGYEKNNEYWNRYISEDGSKFIMAFNKHFDTMPEEKLFTDLKFMIQDVDGTEIEIWNQQDKTVDIDEVLSTHLKYLEGGKGFIYGLFMSVKISDYELEELDIDNYVVQIVESRIKNRTYYPPENAAGIDFSNITPMTYRKFGIQNIYIPKNIMCISGGSFKSATFDNVIFESNRDDYIIIKKWAFAFARINVIKFPNLLNIGNVDTEALFRAQVSSIYFPEQYRVRKLNYYGMYENDLMEFDSRDSKSVSFLEKHLGIMPNSTYIAPLSKG